MSDPFYLAPAPDLSQGDLVDHVPWGLIEAPTTLCRPDNRKSSSGKAFYGSVAELKKPPPWTHDPEFIHGTSWEGIGIVLWHGCQIDKWKHRDLQSGKSSSARSFAGIAPVIASESLHPPEMRTEVMAGRDNSWIDRPRTVRIPIHRELLQLVEPPLHGVQPDPRDGKFGGLLRCPDGRDVHAHGICSQDVVLSDCADHCVLSHFSCTSARRRRTNCLGRDEEPRDASAQPTSEAGRRESHDTVAAASHATVTPIRAMTV